jgi:hypothetical protein
VDNSIRFFIPIRNADFTTGACEYLPAAQFRHALDPANEDLPAGHILQWFHFVSVKFEVNTAADMHIFRVLSPLESILNLMYRAVIGHPKRKVLMTSSIILEAL